MSFTMTSSVRKVRDHFEPEASLDPQEQRALRGHLEQIDYAAFAANSEVLGKAIGHADLARFQRLAVAAANARARWVLGALALAQKPDATPQETAQLAVLRHAYQELTEAYDGLRRMVERGYLPFKPKA
jgi:predicted MarR family transcription regulator